MSEVPRALTALIQSFTAPIPREALNTRLHRQKSSTSPASRRARVSSRGGWHLLMMRRREFVTLLGAAAATWPRAADAQEPAAPLVGILSETPASSIAQRVVAFHQGLQEIGYRQGR